ncbi:hypothetical protein JW710_02335 [Candidatus Dojkabacteria bacterium]|nr:hypothetical protein [Candidatus Dojkabacteria bacterium]
MADKSNGPKPSKVCIVCTMPMVKPEDYPGGNTALDYCVHCGTENGIYPYRKLVKGFAEFMQKTQGMDPDQAMKASKEFIDNCEAVKQGRVKVEK